MATSNMINQPNESVDLGTPSGGTLTNCTGLPVGGLASGTDGELITWDASGNAATVAVGTSGQVLTSNGAGAAPTFQAAGGGTLGTAALGTDTRATGTPQYIFPHGLEFTNGGAVPSTDRIHFLAICVKSDTYTRIGTQVDAGAGSTTMRLGIYEVDTDGSPGALVLDAGTIDTSTTGVKEIVISQALDGWYYLAHIVNGGPTIRRANNNNGAAAYLGCDTTTDGNETVLYKDSQSAEHTALSDPAVGTLASEDYFRSFWIFLRKV